MLLYVPTADGCSLKVTRFGEDGETGEADLGGFRFSVNIGKIVWYY